MQAWGQTPYRHMGCGPGGLDCTNFLAVVLLSAGVLTRIEHNGYYAKDWYVHGEREIVIESLEKNEKHLAGGIRAVRSEYYDEFDFSFGDILLIATHTKNLSNHVAIYLEDGNMMHCLCRLKKSGVMRSQVWPWKRKNKIKHVVRLYVS